MSSNRGDRSIAAADNHDGWMSGRRRPRSECASFVSPLSLSLSLSLRSSPANQLP